MITLTNCKCGALIQQPLGAGGRRIHCRECLRKARCLSSSKWRSNHPEQSKAVAKNFRLSNIERIKEEDCIYSREYRSRNPELAKKSDHDSKKKNREKINFRIRERRRNDPEFNLGNKIRGRISRALHGNSKSVHTIDLIGCKWSELRMWLEFQFQDGMTWENYGPVWHVDHIQPCASFNLSNSEQQKECFNYKNLQPLFAIDNLKKGAKW